ncbi:MAG: hypothetical protein ACREHD_26105 [Pirellulales bacterium]
MARRLLLAFTLLPFLPGCVIVEHRHSIIDLGRFAGPLTDSDLVGRLLLIAAIFGLIGGVAAWLLARCFTGWRNRRRAADGIATPQPLSDQGCY